MSESVASVPILTGEFNYPAFQKSHKQVANPSRFKGAERNPNIKIRGVPVESISRVVDGYRWNTLNNCSEQIFEEALNLDKASFPPFLTENSKPGGVKFPDLMETFKDYIIVFRDPTGNKVLAAGFSAPIHLDGDNLPENGWEGAVHQAVSGLQKETKPNALVAFSASVSPEARGQSMGDKILGAFVQRAKELGVSKVIVPARPSGKSKYPDMSMEDYIKLYDEKTGEHIDPWIRAHQRRGGEVMGIGKNSHVVRSSDGGWPNIEQWREWTGMEFPHDGDYDIPRGNAKLHIYNGVGEYREDCIWVKYDISRIL